MTKANAFRILLCRSANMVFMPHLQKNRPLCDNDRTCKGYFLDSSKETLRNSFISFSTSKKTTRVKQISTRLSQTLTKACKMLRIKENITWYSARGSFISKMVDAGNNPYVVAEMAGNSPLTIYKHYYKNTKREEIKRQMEEMF
jgi:site-specific recombinase XerD